MEGCGHSSVCSALTCSGFQGPAPYKLSFGGAHLKSQHLGGGDKRVRVQGHPQLLSEIKADLGYTRLDMS